MRELGHAPDRVPADGWVEVGALIEAPLTYPKLMAHSNHRIACLLHEGDPDLRDDSVTGWRIGHVAEPVPVPLTENRPRVGLAAAMQHDLRLILLDERSNALSTPPRGSCCASN